MLPVILIVSCLFVLLFLGRMAGARRAALAAQLPILLLGGAALYSLARGSYWVALGLGAAAAIAWILTPSSQGRRRAGATFRHRVRTSQEEAADAEARAVLNVRSGASEAEIRSAYREKMSSAHPDRGGSNAEAARLTAARDRLLKRGR